MNKEKIAIKLVGLGLTHRAVKSSFFFIAIFSMVTLGFLFSTPNTLGFAMVVGVQVSLLMAIMGILSFNPNWKAELIRAQKTKETIRKRNLEPSRSKFYRVIKTGMGCLGCHMGVTIILVSLLVLTGAFDKSETAINIFELYMSLGWIPLSIVLFPIIYKRMI